MEDEDEYWNLYWASKGTHLASSMMRLGEDQMVFRPFLYPRHTARAPPASCRTRATGPCASRRFSSGTEGAKLAVPASQRLQLLQSTL